MVLRGRGFPTKVCYSTKGRFLPGGGGLEKGMMNWLAPRGVALHTLKMTGGHKKVQRSPMCQRQPLGIFSFYVFTYMSVNEEGIGQKVTGSRCKTTP